MTVRLYADPLCWEFKEEHPEEFESYGCGPGGIGDLLVPDTVYGLSIRDACRIHDWGYRHCPDATEEDRKYNDRVFRNNALRIVQGNTKSAILRWLRFRRVQTYYRMVRIFGGPAYWEERNPEFTYKQ